MVWSHLLERHPSAVKSFQELDSAEQQSIVEQLGRLLLDKKLTQFEANRYLPGRAVMVFEDLDLPKDHDIYKDLAAQFPSLSQASQAQVMDLFEEVEHSGLVPPVSRLIIQTKDVDALAKLGRHLALRGTKNQVKVFEATARRPDISDAEKYAVLRNLDDLPTAETVQLLNKLIADSTLAEPYRSKLVGTMGSVPRDDAARAFQKLLDDPKGPRPSAGWRETFTRWQMEGVMKSLSTSVQGEYLMHLAREELEEKEPSLRVLFPVIGRLKTLGEDGRPGLKLVGPLLATSDDQLEEFTLEFVSGFPSKESRSILSTHFSDQVPELPAEMRDFEGSDSADWFRRQSTIAGLLLRAEADSDQTLDTLSKAWAKGFSTFGKKFPAKFLAAFEGARTHLPESARIQFENKLFDEVFKGELEGTPCDTACKTAEQVAYWAKKQFLETPDYKHTAISWKFALNSLGLLFLSRAAPYCDKVAPVVESLLEHLIPGTEKGAFPQPKRTAGFDQLLDLAKTARAVSRSDKGFDKIVAYGKMFYIELMRELTSQRASNPKRNLDYNRIDDELRKTQASLKSELEGFKHPKSLDDEGSGISRPKNFHSMVNSHTGSYFETFMTSMVRLVDPLPEDAQRLLDRVLEDALKESKNPLRLVYGFSRGYRKASERGAAARAVPYHLSYYLRAKNAEEKKRFGEYLVQALENHNKHSGSLIFHIARNSTHKPDGVSEYDGIAPYYYYPSVTAVSIAYKALKKDPLFKDKVESLHALEANYLRRLRLLADREGKFLELGRDRYPSSPAYVNPLAGLALLPYCAPEAQGLVAVPLARSSEQSQSSPPGSTNLEHSTAIR